MRLFNVNMNEHILYKIFILKLGCGGRIEEELHIFNNLKREQK